MSEPSAPSRQPIKDAEAAGPFEIAADEVARKQSWLEGKRRFHIDRYGELLAPYLSSHEVMRLCDYVRVPELGDRKILVIRHDIDHDIHNAGAGPPSG